MAPRSPPSNAYFATCARGLEPVLAGELAALGAEGIEPGRGGVAFRGDAALLYRANLWLRTAVRVLRPILEAPVRSPDELYEAVRTIDWSAFLTPDHTLAVDCNVRDSAITHSQYAARRVKDAICDQFRDKTGKRPSVNVEQPMLGLNLHVHKNRATLSLDSSWGSLHKRGYRPIQTIAPLNEALAAGLLLHAKWNLETALVDPLCGSGTFCIEAAWIALNRPPGLTRKWFGFQGWLEFDRPLWNAIRDEARRGVRKELPAPIRGSDVHRDAIELAKQNARAAGVGHLVKFERLELGEVSLSPSPRRGEGGLRPANAGREPGEGLAAHGTPLTRRPDAVASEQRPLPNGERWDESPGTLICNPPYGERLGDEDELVGLYRRIGDAARNRFPGWRLLVFTSNTRLARKVGLKVKCSTPFYNGKLECRLWEYENSAA